MRILDGVCDLKIFEYILVEKTKCRVRNLGEVK